MNCIVAVSEGICSLDAIHGNKRIFYLSSEGLLGWLKRADNDETNVGYKQYLRNRNLGNTRVAQGDPDKEAEQFPKKSNVLPIFQVLPI